MRCGIHAVTRRYTSNNVSSRDFPDGVVTFEREAITCCRTIMRAKADAMQLPDDVIECLSDGEQSS